MLSYRDSALPTSVTIMYTFCPETAKLIIRLPGYLTILGPWMLGA